MDTSALKPHAYHGMNNFGGIEIHLDSRGDGLYYRDNYDGKPTEWVEAEIEYSDVDNDGDPFEEGNNGAYFKREGDEWMYFLSEFMRHDL